MAGINNLTDLSHYSLGMVVIIYGPARQQAYWPDPSLQLRMASPLRELVDRNHIDWVTPSVTISEQLSVGDDQGHRGASSALG